MYINCVLDMRIPDIINLMVYYVLSDVNFFSHKHQSLFCVFDDIVYIQFRKIFYPYKSNHQVFLKNNAINTIIFQFQYD